MEGGEKNQIQGVCYAITRYNYGWTTKIVNCNVQTKERSSSGEGVLRTFVLFMPPQGEFWRTSVLFMDNPTPPDLNTLVLHHDYLYYTESIHTCSGNPSQHHEYNYLTQSQNFLTVVGADMVPLVLLGACLGGWGVLNTLLLRSCRGKGELVVFVTC